MTTFADGVYQWGGTPVGAGSLPTTPGNVFFVNAATGVNAGSGKNINQPWQTFEYAYSQVVDNNDDVIALTGPTAHTLSAMVTMSKSRVHVIGLDGVNAGRRVSQQRVTLTATSGASNIGTILNLGTDNTFTNVLIDNASSVTEGLYAFVDGGVGTQMAYCRFAKTNKYDVAGASDLVLNGTRCQYVGCTVGSLTTPTSGAIIRAAILCTAAIAGVGLKCTDNIFEEGLVWRNCGNTAARLVYTAAATDIVNMLLFKTTGFINNLAAAALPAQAIGTGATLTTGAIVLDPNCYATNVTKVSTSTGVLVTGPAVAAAAGIGVNAA